MGTTIGTVSYMSPEQARGQEIDARSDVFSAGVVLYEMATGQLPFQGATVATIFEGLLTKQPAAAVADQGRRAAELDHIVFKALEKDRETRYQSAAELRADLKRLKRVARYRARSRPRSRPPVVLPDRRPAGAEASRCRVTEGSGAGWRRPLFVGAPLLTAVLVGGFFFYRSITTPALTAKDTVVLSSVVNRTGDTMFDDTLGEALGLAAAPVAVPERRAGSTGAGHAAADGPRADDAHHRGSRPGSVPARRREGAARRHHRHARLRVRRSR